MVMSPENRDTSADFYKALERLADDEPAAAKSLYKMHQQGCDVAGLVALLWQYYALRYAENELIDDFVAAKKCVQDLLAAISDLRRMIAEAPQSPESASIVEILEKQAPLSGLLDVWIQGLEAGQHRFKPMADRRSGPSSNIFLVVSIEHTIKQMGGAHYQDLANALEWISVSRGKRFGFNADALRKVYERHCALPPESPLRRVAEEITALLPVLGASPEFKGLRPTLIAAITPKVTGRK